MAIGNLITVEEAAGTLGVSTRRVHQFIERKRLSVAERVGPIFMLDKREVEEFAQKQRNPGRPPTPEKK